DQGWEKRSLIDEWVNGFDEYKESLEKFTLEYEEDMTDLSAATLKDTAEEIVRHDKVAICWAMGVTQHQLGSDTSTSIANSLPLTGNYMRNGTGAYALRGHNNVQGCSDFGSMPNFFPGYEDVKDDNVRKRYEKAWDTALPTSDGKDNHEMIKAVHEGNLRSLYVLGED